MTERSGPHTQTVIGRMLESRSFGRRRIPGTGDDLTSGAQRVIRSGAGDERALGLAGAIGSAGSSAPTGTSSARAIRSSSFSPISFFPLRRAHTHVCDTSRRRASSLFDQPRRPKVARISAAARTLRVSAMPQRSHGKRATVNPSRIAWRRLLQSSRHACKLFPMHERRSAAAAIAAILEQRGMSKLELARRLGWGRMRVTRRLAGQTPLTIDELVEIARVLDVPAVHLLSAWGAR